jgi:hypothetical protein
MGSHDPFGHLQHMLWQKKGWLVWLPTIKSRESTQSLCVQVACDTPLESFWRELQLCLRPHPNRIQVACDTPLESSRRELQLCLRPHPDRKSERGVMVPQSCESPNLSNFGTPPWEFQDKKPFGCRPRGEAQRILYAGRWWLPSSLGRGKSCESKVARGSS